jgi:hypothetical protein
MLLISTWGDRKDGEIWSCLQDESELVFTLGELALIGSFVPFSLNFLTFVLLDFS